MKFSKRILCTLLAVVFTLVNIAVVPAFADFTDVATDHSSYDAVNVLSKLGVINGYDDGSFKPTNNVTRAEFTAMLLRTRGMGSMGSTSLENPPFPDVTTPDVSWAIGNIRTARELGIINGYDDGTFKPNNNVSYEEAVKMIVCALGYGEMGSDGAAWYSRYLMTATSLGFINGAGGAIATPATRETIAKMLYNCLEVKLAEDNKITEKTILENDLKLTKKVGFIASNPDISLSTPDSNLRDNEIQITTPTASSTFETLTYKVDDVSKYADMLGSQITFYYTDDFSSGFKTLILATVNNSVTLEINANMIAGQTASTISYYKSDDAKDQTTVNIASDSIVVYNDQIYGSSASVSRFSDYIADGGTLPTIGNVKLLDRDGDKVYDIVFINKYIAYFASAVTASNYTVTDNVLTNDKVVLNPKDSSVKLKFVDENGKETSFSAIRKNSVVCVKKSNAPANGGTPIVEAVVCNNPVTGSVSATNSRNGITINGKTYKFSAQAVWQNSTEPARGDSGTFYLDLNGNIVYFDKNAATSNQQYGYIMSINYDSDNFEESLQLYIMGQNGTKTTYKVDKNSKINGATESSLTSYYTKLQTNLDLSGAGEDPDPLNENHTYSQLVKFSTISRKGEIVIDDIITATATTQGETIDASHLYFYDPMKISTGVCKYDVNNKQFYLKNDSSKKVYIGSATMFSVPKNKATTKDYKKITTADLKNNTDYTVEFYDVSATNSAKFALIYGGATSAGEVKYNSPIMFITDMQTLVERTVITGYINGEIKEYELSSEDNDTQTVLQTLQVGDVVRLGTDDSGFYTIKPEHVIFSATPGYRDTIVGLNGAYPQKENSASGNLAYQVLWGSAYSIDDERMIISKDVLAAQEVATDEFPIQKSWLSGAKIYKYDTTTTKDQITLVDTEQNIEEIDSLVCYDAAATEAPAELFIHMSNATTVKMIIIVIR